MSNKQKKMLGRITATAVMMLLLNILPDYLWRGTAGQFIRFALFFLTYLTIGGDILRKAGRGILNGRVMDENFLMTVATIGAFALAMIERSGDYNEAVAVMFFYQVGEFFQSYAVGKSRQSIAALMDIRPDYANIERDGEVERVDPDEVQPGSIIIVQPGEKIPIDGIVAEGYSSINTSALTGESVPRDAGQGDEVISGCINLTGMLRIRTTRPFGESTVSRILELVENSSSNKSRSEDFISRFARIYTPVVCYAALALAVLPPVITTIAGGNPLWNMWIYRALTFLVISCPCALVISIPLSFFAGIGGASRCGILIKGSNYLETLSKVRTVVFDKTGTLTEGVFKVTAINPAISRVDGAKSRCDAATLLEFAALAESASSHPISRSLQDAYGQTVDRRRVGGVEEIAGHGISAVVDGITVAVGNMRMMSRLGIDSAELPSEGEGAGTIVHIALDGSYAGNITISDVIKSGSVKTIAALKKCGVKKTVMLTGDSAVVAERVAASIGLDEFHAELLPSDKVFHVERLLGDGKGGKLAFVGDGINDAPVLSRADIGIAMGAMGSDAAIEAADVVLMDDDLLKIPQAVAIAGKCLGIVRQNIIFALSVKGLCLLLGAVGIADMWLAIFADVGVMVIAVVNAMRALRVR